MREREPQETVNPIVRRNWCRFEEQCNRPADRLFRRTSGKKSSCNKSTYRVATRHMNDVTTYHILLALTTIQLSISYKSSAHSTNNHENTRKEEIRNVSQQPDFFNLVEVVEITQKYPYIRQVKSVLERVRACDNP